MSRAHAAGRRPARRVLPGRGTTASCELRLIASYGYTPRKGIQNVFQQGESLVGQAALERKPILVDRGAGRLHPGRLGPGRGRAGEHRRAAGPVRGPGARRHRAGVAASRSARSHRQFLEQIVETSASCSPRSSPTRAPRSCSTSPSAWPRSCRASPRSCSPSRTSCGAPTSSWRSRPRRSRSSEELLQNQQEELQQTNAELEEKAAQLAEQNEAIEIKNREIELARLVAGGAGRAAGRVARGTRASSWPT